MNDKLFRKVMAVALSVAMVLSIIAPNINTVKAEAANDLVVYYDFADYSSTIINDMSGNGRAAVMMNYDKGGFTISDDEIFGTPVKALNLPGGADGGYMEFPTGILSGLDSATISVWVKLATDTAYQRIWDFGNDTTSYMYLLSDGYNPGAEGYAAAITNGGWSNEQVAHRMENIDKNRWVLTTVVIDGKKLTLYENGKKVDEKKTTIGISDIGATSRNFLGYGQFGDAPTKGSFAQVKIYGRALSDDEIAEMYSIDDEAMVDADIADISLGIDANNVTDSFKLPVSGNYGSVISWISNNTSVINIEGDTASVTRPAVGSGDAQVKLTASFTIGSTTKTKEFDLKVPAHLGDEAIVALDKEALSLGDTSALIARLELATAGENGSVITWESSDESVVLPNGRVIRPEYGEPDAKAVLTATISYGAASDTKEFEITVLAKTESKTIAGYEPVNVTTTTGYSPKLPNYVTVNYSDGSSAKLKAVWPAYIDSSKYAQTGTFSETGTIIGENYEIEADITVVDEDPEVISLLADSFDLSDISLDGSSILTENRDRNLAYLKKLDADRMLYNFRLTFGQDTLGAAAVGGWDEPTGLLRGHSTGHFISGLSIAYASTKDEEIKKKLDYIVHEMRTLQLLSKGRPQDFVTKGTPNNAAQSIWSTNPDEWGEGFLSAYSPDQFALLEQKTPYATIWAPYYTLHKLIAGFIDAYEYAGNEEALLVAEGIGNWVYERLTNCTTPELRTQMWDMYIAGEFGGFNESMAKLYEITKNEKYLEGAKLFDNTLFFDQLDKNVDAIRDRHANQHIPQIIGSLEIYNSTVLAGSEDRYYYNVAKNFWDMAVSRYAYSTGGVGTGERFKEPYEQAAYIQGDTNCETCAAYNMMKLTKMLYQFEPDNAEYMDYYERTMYNQILASQDRSRSTSNSVTYMLPIGPGASKTGGGDYDSFTCCHGTGMENHVKYQEAVYYKSENDLYVNLYMPATVNWDEKGVVVKQETTFPSETSKLTVAAKEGSVSQTFNMKLRVPYWTDNYSVSVNGSVVNIEAEPSSYVTLEGINAGDVIEVVTPYSYHIDATPDKLGTSLCASIMYGPWVMAAQDDSSEFKNIVLSKDLSQSIKAAEGSDTLAVSVSGMTLKPMYEIPFYTPYHAYFKVLLTNDDSNYYEVSVTNETPKNGEFTVNTSLAKEGSDVTVIASPKEGYKVKSLTVNGKSIEPVAENGNEFVIKNVSEALTIVGRFGLIKFEPNPDELEQSAETDSDYTSSWEVLDGIKNKEFEPAQSAFGTGRGWGNWPQDEGSEHYVSYTWDGPVKINTNQIYWYDDGGGTRVPSSVVFEYLDENGNWQTANMHQSISEINKTDQYNTITFDDITTTCLKLKLVVAAGAQATGIGRWKVSYVAVEEATPEPTKEPVATESPTTAPTAKPTTAPTAKPTTTPTESPTAAPTQNPTEEPKNEPTAIPTNGPADNTKPIVSPSINPGAIPTASPNPDTQAEEIVKGSIVTTGDISYTVDSVNGKTGTVTIKNVAKKKTNVVIPKTIKKNGVKLKVVGIGKKAFNKCRKVKKITIKSRTIKKIGKKALRKLNKKVIIKVPKKNKKLYRKLIKRSGFKGRVR